ncbi:MAG: endonuclease domain-containing protein [Hyphomonadaceae bacterium]|nr:endonuclease domain-containing protein [Hyphomonadaceae bacterium]
MRWLVKDERTQRRAIGLRREMTEPERVLWMLLRDRRFAGFKFRRQAPLGDVVVDFVCYRAKLAIELDGSHHGTPEQSAFDAQRTAHLNAAGFRVLRIWNHDLDHQREAVGEAIWRALTHKD